jgi:hypothetical protein
MFSHERLTASKVRKNPDMNIASKVDGLRNLNKPYWLDLGNFHPANRII